MAEPGEEEEVVKVEAQDLVRVQVCYRKTGPAGSSDPHGTVKLEVLLPRSSLKHWATARQFKTVGSPNINVVFEGQVIRPPIAGSLALGEEAEGLVVQDVELQDLTTRRDGLRVDIARMEAQLTALTEQHGRVRRSYAEDEQRLQASVSVAAEQLKRLRDSYTAEETLIHNRITKMLEVEKEVTDSISRRITKYDDDLTQVVNRESALNNEIEDLRRIARDKADGGAIERIATRVERNIGAIVGSKVGQDFLARVLNKIG
jgi:hypothetical protein